MEIVSLKLEAGAGLELHDRHGDTALSVACRRDDIVCLLRKHEAANRVMSAREAWCALNGVVSHVMSTSYRVYSAV